MFIKIDQALDDPFSEVDFTYDIDVSGAPIRIVIDSAVGVHLVFDEDSTRSVRLLMDFKDMKNLKRLLDEQLQIKV